MILAKFEPLFVCSEMAMIFSGFQFLVSAFFFFVIQAEPYIGIRPGINHYRLCCLMIDALNYGEQLRCVYTSEL